MQVRGILNKLTPEKFEKLINDVLNVGLDSSTILKGVIVLVRMSIAQCGNFMIFLSLRFYVKPILENLEVLKLPILPFLRP